MWPFKKQLTVEHVADAIVRNAVSELGSEGTAFVEYVSALLPSGDRRKSALQENVDGKLSVELMVCYIHLVDRLAFAHLSESKRRELMGCILDYVLTEMFARSPQMAADWTKAYGDRTPKYGNCAVRPEKGDQGLAGTLFWEMAETVAQKVYGDAHLAVYLTTIPQIPLTLIDQRKISELMQSL